MLINFSHPKKLLIKIHLGGAAKRILSFFMRRSSFAEWFKQKGSKLTLIYGRIFMLMWNWPCSPSPHSFPDTRQSNCVFGFRSTHTTFSFEAWNITEARDVEIGSNISSYSTAVLRRSTWSFSWRIWVVFEKHQFDVENYNQCWSLTYLATSDVENCFILRPGTSSNWSFWRLFSFPPHHWNWSRASFFLWCWMKWWNCVRRCDCFRLLSNALTRHDVKDFIFLFFFQLF